MNQTPNSSWNAEPGLSGSRGRALREVYLAASALAMFACVCGAAGNSVVVWLLSAGPRRTPFCVYMLNLAAADLLFLLCMASELSLETPALADRFAEAYEAVSRVKYFAYTTSLSLLTAISTQRCLAVLFPVWYKSRRPRHLSTAVSALLWALFLLMNLLASAFCSKFWQHSKSQCFTIDVVLSTLIMGVFTPVMTVSGLTLYIRVRRSALLRRRKPRRLLLVILASVLVFLVCSLPLGLYWFVLYWLPLPPEAELLCICLARLSSAVGSSANPVIYFLVGSQRTRRLAEPLQAVLGRALQEEPELEGRETPSTGTNSGL
ncbi:Mas-related G-protein coupled receptor member D [Sciurus carolinensis]|uniref:Mas-related G-protein coupled receptor member D n=2 Tax=Sciurus carolinensis TaxID=30640 RepID=A0AA41NEZ4_SCICA|nr:Mas-related G-protein coupled receptor member D [Sciurus carolinensis]